MTVQSWLKRKDMSANAVLGLEDFQARVLGGVEGLQKSIAGHESLIRASGADVLKLKEGANAVQLQLAELQRRQAEFKSRTLARPGQVGEECARHMGGLAVAAGLVRGQLSGDRYEGLVKDILGVEARAALTSSDIALPVQYSGEIAELVGQFGAARQYGTVFPLGTASVKLPKLTTDPTFTLIAASATVTEKSPQFGWVTFTPEKFGGLVRIPSEIEADSIVALGQWIARYSARNIALVEDYNYFIGTGAGSGQNGSVAGLTASTITNTKVSQMASTKTHYSDMTLANIRAIRAVCDAAALRNGAYYLHPSFEQALSGLNTAGDKPYQANGLGGATLDGFPIRWVDVMPVYSVAVNVSKVFALFGDMSFQYLGVRGGIRFDTSNEAAFATDEILVRAVERFTIGLMAVGSVAGLQTAAS